MCIFLYQREKKNKRAGRQKRCLTYFPELHNDECFRVWCKLFLWPNMVRKWLCSPQHTLASISFRLPEEERRLHVSAAGSLHSEKGSRPKRPCIKSRRKWLKIIYFKDTCRSLNCSLFIPNVMIKRRSRLGFPQIHKPRASKEVLPAHLNPRQGFKCLGLETTPFGF